MFRSLHIRPQSVSANSEMGSNSFMNDLLECPVCMTFMYPPIYQCSNGHTICFTCKNGVRNSCPICRQELGNIRCIALEKVAERLDLPCKFHLFGCQDIYSYHNRLKHEQICSFRPYNCPYDGTKCSITGDIRSLVAHLKETHCVESFDVEDGYTFNQKYSIPETDEVVGKYTWTPRIIKCLSHQFYVHFEAFNMGKTHVFMVCLRFMGDESEAKRFRYCLKVGEKERKMKWQGIPRSIRDSNKIIRDSLDALFIQKNLTLFSSGVEQKLNLKVACRVWRED